MVEIMELEDKEFKWAIINIINVLDLKENRNIMWRKMEKKKDQAPFQEVKQIVP